MSDIVKVRAVVSRFFQVPEADIDESFVFPTSRLQGSLARTTFRSAVRRLANVDLPSAMTAITFGELVADIDRSVVGRHQHPPASSPQPRAEASPARKEDPNAVPARLPRLLTGIDVESAGVLPWGHDAAIAEAFFQENFSAAEIAHARGRPEPELSFLGLWAAKEAVLKCGWAGLLRPRHVEIAFGSDGDPKVVFAGEAGSLAHNAGRAAPDPQRHSISISHTTGVAVAVCVRLA